MERDPYNENISWLPQQEQVYEEQVYEEQEYYQRSDLPTPWSESPQQAKYQKIQPVPRIPEGEKQALLQGLKKGLVISSLIGFGALSWLTMSHAAATMSWQTSPYPAQFQPAFSSDDRGDFFEHHDGRFFGRHHHDEDSYHWQYQNQFSGQDQDSDSISGTHVSP